MSAKPCPREPTTSMIVAGNTAYIEQSGNYGLPVGAYHAIWQGMLDAAPAPAAEPPPDVTVLLTLASVYSGVDEPSRMIQSLATALAAMKKAGLRAGMERAAKICEVKAQWDYAQPEVQIMGSEQRVRIAMGNRCDDCAQDIRAAMGTD